MPWQHKTNYGTINQNRENQKIMKRYIMILMICIGIFARFWVSQRGYNADYVSWEIVAKIISSGGNVYAETTRYNYGPVWFTFLHLFRKIADMFAPSYHALIFRSLIIGLLTLVDVGIFFVLYSKISPFVAYLFWLNPISIIITGYHNQFDNFALFLGLYAVVLIGDDVTQSILTRWKLIGLGLLGVSLMTKHIFFLFPIWLAAKQKTLRAKILALSIPVIIFLIGFLPYWSVGNAGIIQNVFRYNSMEFPVFYIFFIPTIIKIMITSKQIWFLFLILFAFIHRQKSILASLLLYTAIFLMASPSMANQYLAIVIPVISLYYKNIFFLLYTIIGSLYLIVHPAGLHYYIPFLLRFSEDGYWIVMINVLCLGCLWELAIPYVPTLGQKMMNEITIQIRG